MKLLRVRHDDPRLPELHRRCFPCDRFPDWAVGAWWILVGDEAQTIGFAGIQPSAQWRDCAYLVRSGVLPEYRGHGLQRRLINVRERYAKRCGLNWIVTATWENVPSANNLIACGYRMYVPRRPWLAKGAIYWRKRISHEADGS